MIASSTLSAEKSSSAVRCAKARAHATEGRAIEGTGQAGEQRHQRALAAGAGLGQQRLDDLLHAGAFQFQLIADLSRIAAQGEKMAHLRFARRQAEGAAQHVGARAGAAFGIGDQQGGAGHAENFGAGVGQRGCFHDQRRAARTLYIDGFLDTRARHGIVNQRLQGGVTGGPHRRQAAAANIQPVAQQGQGGGIDLQHMATRIQQYGGDIGLGEGAHRPLRRRMGKTAGKAQQSAQRRPRVQDGFDITGFNTPHALRAYDSEGPQAVTHRQADTGEELQVMTREQLAIDGQLFAFFRGGAVAFKDDGLARLGLTPAARGPQILALPAAADEFPQHVAIARRGGQLETVGAAKAVEAAARRAQRTGQRVHGALPQFRREHSVETIVEGEVYRIV